MGSYDSGAGSINVYIDGVLNASASGVPADAYGTNARPFVIGNHFNRGLAATIDEVAVYDSALSAGRVAEHFDAAGLVTSTPTPEGWSRVLAIDFGNSIGAGGGPGGTQSGFEAFEDTETAGTAPRSNSFSSIAGGGGDVDVTISGFQFFRDYSTHAATYGQDELLSDMVLRNSDGTMTLEIADLLSGDYVVRTYHTSSQFGGGAFDLAVNDANGDGSFTESGVLTASNGELRLLDLPVTANGADPISIDLSGGAGSQHLSLNGFEVYLVPEPGSTLLLLAGSALIALRRRRC